MDNKKVKRLSKEETRTKLLDSMAIDEIVKFDDLNKEAGKNKRPRKSSRDH